MAAWGNGLLQSLADLAEVMIDFRQGRWQDVLADVGKVDVLLTDPPYSERTHAGFRTGADLRKLDAIQYDCMQEIDAYRFVDRWAPKVTDWALMFGDHVSARWWGGAWAEAGWYTFAPVIWWRTDAPPRVCGDGPASPCDRLVVARPKSSIRLMGHRDGLYRVRTGAGRSAGSQGVIGVKDIGGLMRLLKDYTRPGDLVCDPFGGTATVGAAAKATGRNYIGSEVDPQTYALGMERLANTQETPDWSWPDRWRDRDVKQGGLGL